MNNGHKEIFDAILKGEEGGSLERGLHVVGEVLGEGPQPLEDEEVAGHREEHEEVEAEVDGRGLQLLDGRVEEAEAQDRAGVEGDHLQVALKHEEEEVEPEGVRPEQQRYPIAKKHIEEYSTRQEEEEREEDVGGEETEGADKDSLPISLPLLEAR